jgi:phosphate transport system permease protein
VKRQHTQKLVFGIITAIAALVVIPIVLVILFIIVNGISAINWEFLTAPPRNGMREGGIMPALLGTVFLTFGPDLRNDDCLCPVGHWRSHLPG